MFMEEFYPLKCYTFSKMFFLINIILLPVRQEDKVYKIIERIISLRQWVDFPDENKHSDLYNSPLNNIKL